MGLLFPSKFSFDVSSYFLEFWRLLWNESQLKRVQSTFRCAWPSTCDFGTWWTFVHQQTHSSSNRKQWNTRRNIRRTIRDHQRHFGNCKLSYAWFVWIFTHDNANIHYRIDSFFCCCCSICSYKCQNLIKCSSFLEQWSQWTVMDTRDCRLFGRWEILQANIRAHFFTNIWSRWYFS